VKEGPYDPKAARRRRRAGPLDRRSGPAAQRLRRARQHLALRHARPEQAAHLLGKLLKAFGEDRVLWGTDSIWYGSPQDQIQAFRAFQISPEFQEKYGYPALTPALKRKVFGLNAMRVYALDASAMRKKLSKDAVQKRKADYLNDPRPSFATYGPRNRAEFLALRELQGGMP
jgi:hypothetical protein